MDDHRNARERRFEWHLTLFYDHAKTSSVSTPARAPGGGPRDAASDLSYSILRDTDIAAPMYFRSARASKNAGYVVRFACARRAAAARRKIETLRVTLFTIKWLKWISACTTRTSREKQSKFYDRTPGTGMKFRENITCVYCISCSPLGGATEPDPT